ncbi:glycosyltransferase family 4 protein [Devosia sp. MC521]|uniref:glycosyltransferase family 4 protein n=1 Tax=Devosia sp. MC521 TaxID=2759954 RepID=UPI0015FAB750|nr:glycosyltransferase family 4 protein [Devosia sp. MC521]MBJ6989213.1 glycosyltransferase family 4 protein [Devosia sp. MC521]QMW63289.1 glycosyltransferase family 4 protein [Devosia sp. MC521]
MKIIVHDFSGHAFTSQLARALAGRGHDVLYASFGGFQTPKGKTTRRDGDPETFRARELVLPEAFDKDNLLRRRRQQIAYARAISGLVQEEKPDVVLSANAPLEVAQAIYRASRSVGSAYVFWVQDIYSEAIERILSKRSRIVGYVAGIYYRFMERALLANSDAAVVIAEEFRSVFQNAPWSLDVSRVNVIENWGIIADVPLLPRDNDWAKINMPGDRPRIVYSGTLARKHNPNLLLELARKLDADIYVFSEGSAPTALAAQAAQEGLANLHVRPWVPVEELPSMLAGADVLFALIEPDAGIFSVPSKVLSYLSAGRAILAAIPGHNLAARNVLREKAGLVSEPGDLEALVTNASRLLEDVALRKRMGENGRRFAERAFDIDNIADRFEGLLGSSCGVRPVQEQRSRVKVVAP